MSNIKKLSLPQNGHLHWVPLTTTSVITSYYIQEEDFFASKSMTAMLKSSFKTKSLFGNFLLVVNGIQCIFDLTGGHNGVCDFKIEVIAQWSDRRTEDSLYKA